MPAYLQPGLRVPVWLRIDEKVEPRPQFWSRVLTMAEAVELGGAIDDMHEDVEGLTTRQLFDRGQELLKQYVDGWEHLPEDFTLDQLMYSELRELLIAISAHQWLEKIEKKELESRPSYVQANCASAAA